MTPDELYDLLERHPKACALAGITLLPIGYASSRLRHIMVGATVDTIDHGWFANAVRGQLVSEAARRGLSIITETPTKYHITRVGTIDTWDVSSGSTIIAALLAALEDA